MQWKSNLYGKLVFFNDLCKTFIFLLKLADIWNQNQFKMHFEIQKTWSIPITKCQFTWILATHLPCIYIQHLYLASFTDYQIISTDASMNHLKEVFFYIGFMFTKTQGKLLARFKWLKPLQMQHLSRKESFVIFHVSEVYWYKATDHWLCCLFSSPDINKNLRWQIWGHIDFVIQKELLLQRPISNHLDTSKTCSKHLSTIFILSIHLSTSSTLLLMMAVFNHRTIIETGITCKKISL